MRLRTILLSPLALPFEHRKVSEQAGRTPLRLRTFIEILTSWPPSNLDLGSKFDEPQLRYFRRLL